MLSIHVKTKTPILGHLAQMKNINVDDVLGYYGDLGVLELSKKTPIDTGKTASCWGYRIEKKKSKTFLIFYNTNINDGVNVAVVLQYGHGTPNGMFVQGIDYINPALGPLFNNIKDSIWKEITK